MLVAGSVLALLLMGLAVDGFLSMDGGETEDDLDAGDGAEDDQDDQSGVSSSALSDLLFPDDEGEDATTPEEEDETFRLALSGQGGWHADAADLADPAEGDADTDWEATAEVAAARAEFLEVEDMTGLASGEEVAYVETFDTETDALILEFDGYDEDAPDITIDLDSEDDAAVVLANGVPVTLVEGATEMTTDHVRVLMSGEGIPAVQPDSPASLGTVADFDTGSALDADLDGVAGPAPDAPSDLPLGNDLLPVSDTLADPDLDAKPDAPVTPSVLPAQAGLEGLLPLRPVDPDPTVADVEEVILGDVTETVLDPVTDVVDTLTDGLPADDIVDALLDGISDSLAGLGGSEEMLDARTQIDDAFGTGGEDALTGGFNDDMISGTDGQDALFGGEGADTLLGGGGNDELHGDTGDDLLQGGDGVDFLDGGDGNDTLDGGAGRDLLFGGDGDDVLAGGAGDDFLQGGMGSDTLNGGSGNDVLDGTFGRNGMDHDDGDVLWGGDGDDTIIVGQGDIAHGNDGADLFIAGSYIEAAEVAGSVTDFDPGMDRIEVIFDPDLHPNPILEVLDFEDGSGADIVLNGEVILSVTGAQGLDPNLIELRAVA